MKNTKIQKIKNKKRPQKINKEEEIKEEVEEEIKEEVEEEIKEENISPISSSLYFAELNMNDNIYKSEGETAFEALSNFEIDWTKIKTKGVITLAHGEQKAEKLFYLKPLRLLFVSKVRRVGFAKQLESLMKF